MSGRGKLEGKPKFTAAQLAKMKELPGEFSAEQILNGEYQWPPSPKVSMSKVKSPYFKRNAFGKVPKPGAHPRILFSPKDLPDIRRRSEETEVGRLSLKNLRIFQQKSLHKVGTSSYNVYQALLAGDLKKARKLLDNYDQAGTSDGVHWHHRPQFPYILVLEAFDCLLRDDQKQGKELAKVITSLAKIYQENLDELYSAFRHPGKKLVKEGLDGNAMKINGQLISDVWRSGARSAIGGEPFFAYMYDFAYNWMNKKQQQTCRKVINDYIRGGTTMGSHMPHHFRNWNWIAVGAGLLLTACATEGEPGHDARVYKHQVEVQTDYLKYGWSDMGSSREAIGYTQFGLGWSGPALVAMARRGENLWNLERWYNSINWYVNSIQPGGGRFQSHGDGGQGGPTAKNLLQWKTAYPNDPLIDFVAREAFVFQNKGEDKFDGGPGFLVYLLIFAQNLSDNDYKMGKKLGLPNTFFDPERNSLITRSEWGPEEVQLQFECRDDGIGPSHQHSDRGNFTFGGAGRTWAVERFRGIESRHHNVVVIDGKGQGYVPPPGKWLKLADKKMATFGAIDAKYSYDWYWEGALSGYADKSQPRRYFQRWENFAKQADNFMAENPDFDWEANLDRSPKVEKYYNGFESGDPRMWDEYSRPVRIEFNPVEKAFRTAGLVRGKHPYSIIVDDIKKDDKMHHYNWTMMTDSDVQPMSITLDEIILGGAVGEREGLFEVMVPTPKKGDPQLLVKVLNRNIPEDPFNNPAIRMETFEYKDAREWPNGRSFGLAKRLIIPSFSVEPDFKILLFPYKHGEKLPKTKWNKDRTKCTISWKDQKDVVEFKTDSKGRTHIRITRNGKLILNI